MNQVWLPLECNGPDLRLWSLNVVALIHSEDKKKMELGGSLFGGASLGLWRSLKGKLVVPLSLEHLSWI